MSTSLIFISILFACVMLYIVVELTKGIFTIFNVFRIFAKNKEKCGKINYEILKL